MTKFLLALFAYAVFIALVVFWHVRWLLPFAIIAALAMIWVSLRSIVRTTLKSNEEERI